MTRLTTMLYDVGIKVSLAEKRLGNAFELLLTGFFAVPAIQSEVLSRAVQYVGKTARIVEKRLGKLS